MKLITTNAALRGHLSRLIRDYPNIAFAVAWASANTGVFRQLLDERTRITRGVIGTHFYQTHPDVLDAFTGSASVRFILQPTGVFHPKLYVFWNATQWEALVGSANLTNGALNANSEVVVLLSGRDDSTATPKAEMLSCIDGYWASATMATSDTVLAYRSIWERQQSALRRLAGQYGEAATRKAPVCVVSHVDAVDSVRCRS